MRERHARELRESYPWLPGRRVALLSDLSARVELAARWAEERGITSNRHGRVYPVVDRLEAWSRRLTDELAKLDVEARERAVAGEDSYQAVVAEITAEYKRGQNGE